MLLTTIPADIMHDVFLLLDDRKTLVALVSTNHLLYEVFKANPNSILRQVVCNEIGMYIRVFPYALASTKSCGEVYMPEESMDWDQEIQPQDHLTVLLTSRSFEALKNRHGAVCVMAKQYSTRFKDGRILRDSLTAEETRRFHIAAHLFINYQALWYSNQGDVSDESESDREAETEQADSEDAAVVQDVMTISACHSFLTNLTTDELFWMQEFRDFLLHDIDYTLGFKKNPAVLDAFLTNKYGLRGSETFSRHFLLSISVIYFGKWHLVFLGDQYHPTQLHRTELWLTDAISRVLQERGVGKQDKDQNHQTPSRILSSKGVLIQACQKCGNEKQGTFVNETNMEIFYESWRPLSFPGGLSLNPLETERAFKRIYGAMSPQSTSMQARIAATHEIMEHSEAQVASGIENGRGIELLASEDCTEGSRTDHRDPEGTEGVMEGHKWDLNDVLCLACFNAMFSGLYYACWLEERKTDRVEAHVFAGGPCWWGIECEFQHRYDHAALRNESRRLVRSKVAARYLSCELPSHTTTLEEADPFFANLRISSPSLFKMIADGQEPPTMLGARDPSFPSSPSHVNSNSTMSQIFPHAATDPILVVLTRSLLYLILELWEGIRRNEGQREWELRHCSSFATEDSVTSPKIRELGGLGTRGKTSWVENANPNYINPSKQS